MMICTEGNARYKEQIKPLWSRAFGDPDSFVDFYFEHMWQGENAITMLEDGQVIGALQLVPYTLSLRGAEVPCSYIVGVSTSPEHRMRGVAKSLMKAALQEEKKRGDVFSLLIPFSYPFYQKMGYECCYEELSCTMQKTDSPSINGTWKKATLADWETLQAIYLAFCRDKNGYVYRAHTEWKFIFDFAALVEAQIDMFYLPSGTPCGYLYYLRNQKRFRVIEAAWISPEAKDAIVHHAMSLSPFQTFDWLLPQHSPIPKEKDVVKALPSAMARIVDIPKALAKGLGGLCLEVTDDFFPENSGIYEEMNGTVCKVEGSPHASISIGALTQQVLGYHPSQKLNAADNGFASVLAETLYPKQKNYINGILRDV